AHGLRRRSALAALPLPPPPAVFAAVGELETAELRFAPPPAPAPHTPSGPAAARRAVPWLLQPWSATFERVAPGLPSVAEYGVVELPMITEPEIGLSALMPGGALDTSVTGTVVEARTVVPCFSCSSRLAAPGARIPMPPPPLDA